MKKILTVSLVAIMAVSAARADIASTEYVGLAVGASETTVKAYVDEKTADIATNAEVSAIKTAIDGYGDIVTHNVAEFATAEQGTKADAAATSVKGFIDGGLEVPAKPTDGKDYALVSGENGLEWQVIVYELPAAGGEEI